MFVAPPVKRGLSGVRNFILKVPYWHMHKSATSGLLSSLRVAGKIFTVRYLRYRCRLEGRGERQVSQISANAMLQLHERTRPCEF